MSKILTTHVGSLIRPDALTPYLEKITDREHVRPGGIRRRADRLGRRRRPPPGGHRPRPHRRRRVQQGQLDHLLLRPRERDRGAGDRPGRHEPAPGRPRPRGVRRVLRGPRHRPGDRGRQAQRPRRARRARRRHGVDGQGHPVGVHGPDHLRRRVRAARHRQPPGGAGARSTSTDGFLPGRRARERVLAARTSTTRATRSSSSRSPTRCSVEYTPDRRRRAHAPGRRRASSVHELGTAAAGGQVDRGLPCAGRRCGSRRSNHALTGIPPERVRYHVCCGSWHGAHTTRPAARRRSSTSSSQVQRRRVPVRAGQPRATSTSGRCGEDVDAAGRQDPRAGRRHAPHARGRASRAHRPAARAPGGDRRPRSACRRAPTAASPRARCTRRVHASGSQWAKLEALVEGARIASERMSGLRAVA